MAGQGKSVSVIDMPDRAVEPGRTFHYDLLKGICNTELSVDNNTMAMTDAHADGMDHLWMASCRHRAQIVFVIHHIGRGDLLGQIPLAGLCPRLNDAVRLLSE